jgi:hypothetical protein
VRPPSVARSAFRYLPPTYRTALLHRSGRFVPWEDGFDFTPPVPRPGEAVGPPDFVGVGVQKAGTSWWYELIHEHPGVSDRDDVPKERHFLTRFCAEPFGEPEIRRYHQWFPRRSGTLTGEWTPDYFDCPWVPQLLAAAAADCKVLILLRDPIDRLQSGLTFRLRQGAPNTAFTVADAVRQSFYAKCLRRFLRYFPIEQVLVLQFEKCRSDPASQLATTYRFLGLDDFEPEGLRREVNVIGGEKVRLDVEARKRLVDLYRPDVEDLAGIIPNIDLSWWPNFRGSG